MVFAAQLKVPFLRESESVSGSHIRGAVGRDAVAVEDRLAAAVQVLVPEDDLALAVRVPDAGKMPALQGRQDAYPTRQDADAITARDDRGVRRGHARDGRRRADEWVAARQRTVSRS